jgi:D-alanine-D-alanine ligase-like ATP-grasp enzyme
MRKNTALYFKSALHYFLPVFNTPEIDGFALQFGRKFYYFRDALTPFNDTSSCSIANNKYCTNKLLEASGLPVPKATAISAWQYQQDMLDEFIVDFKYPLVAKPTDDTSLGKDVLCNIKDKSQLINYLEHNFPKYPFITIEEFYDNLNCYRILVFNYKVIAVIQRFPAQVIGDGIHTIEELIRLENIKRPLEHEVLAPIMVDEECRVRLQELGLTLQDIPAQEQKITLGYTCNSTRGGSFITLGKKIGRSNRKLMKAAARIMNLNLVGFDLVCADLKAPLQISGGVIIEANCRPSIRVHEESTRGRPQRVSRTIMRSFLYRHPLSYILSLFKHSKTRVYARTAFILSLGTLLVLLGKVIV